MIVVTMGGVIVGLIVLGWHLIEWYPGRKALLGKKRLAYAADLLPFIFGWAYGTLGILAAMGVIGWAFDSALWASNWLGDAALWVGVGEAPQQTAAGAPVQLSGPGNAMVLITTFMVIALVKFRPCGKSVARGAWVGLCLGTSANFAGFAAGHLAMGANVAGATLFGGA